MSERVNLMIRMDQELKEEIKKQAKEQGFTTMTQYVKFLVANDKEKKSGRN